MSTKVKTAATNGLSIPVEIKNPNGYSEGFGDNYLEHLPPTTRARLTKYNVDLSKGYPERPTNIPTFLDDAYKIRDKPNENYIDRGKNADPEKKALFAKVKEVRHLTKYIGTELVGVQIQDLSEQELDELALLVAERVVVFFKNQDLSPQKQLEIGNFYSSDNVEVHPMAAHIPGLPGTTVVWAKFNKRNQETIYSKGVFTGLHTDLVHEVNPAGITHLHIDSIPPAGGDTVWVSGYAAYDKLSPAFKKFLDGKKVVQISGHRYLERDNLTGGPKHIERESPLVVTHPVTGWKSLNINPSMTVRIVGLEPQESALVLKYLNDVYDSNLDIQVRFNWQDKQDFSLGASAIWDNRISQHAPVNDYLDSKDNRHAVRVSSLSYPLKFVEGSKSQREALNLD
jgi:alpha-ketoglutarate-dependent taurine dioxygenase